jgi:hypothetical protein
VAGKSRMRRFVMIREQDISGVSGTGVVAEGVVYSNGVVGLTWLSHLSSHAFYHSFDVMEAIHGHGGATKIQFLDPKAEG